MRNGMELHDPWPILHRNRRPDPPILRRLLNDREPRVPHLHIPSVRRVYPVHQIRGQDGRHAREQDVLARGLARRDHLHHRLVVRVHAGLEARAGQRCQGGDDERGVGAGGEDRVDEGRQRGGRCRVNSVDDIVRACHQEDDLQIFLQGL